MNARYRPSGRRRNPFLRFLRGIGVLIAVIAGVAVLILAGMWVAPSSAPSDGFVALPMTADGAAAAYTALIDADAKDPDVLPVCRTRRVDPKTGKPRGVVVLFHGYTSCPNQFSGVAAKLAADGYIVLVPRQAGHGIAQRSLEQGHVDVNEYAKFGSTMIDIAHGLSEHVIVGGASGGAVLSLWLAQQRDDIERVVALSPTFALGMVPDLVIHPVANLLASAPEFDLSWDSVLTETTVPSDSYSRFSTRSLGSLMSIGEVVRASTKVTTAQLVYLVNEADGSANAGAIRAEAARQSKLGAKAQIVDLPAALAVPPALVDPTVFAVALAQTVPAVVELLETGTTRVAGATG